MKITNIIVLSVSSLIFTILNYLFYINILFPYLFNSILQKYINTPAFLLIYLSLSTLVFLLILLQLKNHQIHKSFLICMVILYIPVLLFVLLGKSIGIRGVNLNILNIFLDIKTSSFECFMNIIIVIPIGILLKQLNRKTIIISIITIFLIELSQYVFSLGIFDIADIVFNLIGIILGYQLRYLLIQKGIRFP